AATAWRQALLSTDDVALDTVGHSTYPHGSDPDDVFLDVVWWVNQELLHHGAEIALLRDLFRTRRR
ncbi:DinB family protein, partial [Streptomyces spiralis]